MKIDFNFDAAISLDDIDFDFEIPNLDDWDFDIEPPCFEWAEIGLQECNKNAVEQRANSEGTKRNHRLKHG